MSAARLVKKFVRHFDRVARPEYGLTRPCYTNYSGSTRLRVIADQYRNRPTILRLPKMNTASRLCIINIRPLLKSRTYAPFTPRATSASSA